MQKSWILNPGDSEAELAFRRCNKNVGADY